MKAASKRKVVVIGMDALLPNFVSKFVEEGKLPNFAKLIKRGCFSHAIPSFPTETGTNWATIATGADPHIHQCKFWVHYPGSSLAHQEYGFSSQICKAEQIWTTGEKVGKRSVIFDYPQSWPINSRSVIHVGEDGGPDPASHKEIAFSMVYSTKKLPEETYVNPGVKPLTVIKLQPASGWEGTIGSHKPALESILTVKQLRQAWHHRNFTKTFPVLGPPVHFHLLIIDSQGKGYDQVLVTTEKNVNKVICKLSPKNKVGWLKATFKVDEEAIEGACRLRLLDLSPDNGSLRLLRSQVYPLDFAYPQKVNEELLDLCGPYIHHPYSWHPFSWGWLDKNDKRDREAYLEESGYQTRWYAEAAKHILTNYDWDLFMLKWHGPDHMQHALWSDIDPVHPLHDPQRADLFWDYVARYYALGDEMVGEVMDVLDENTVIIVVSDHGFIAHVKSIDIDKAYEKAGLLVKNPDGSTNWSQTKAFRGYVNLKGRDPKGIVEMKNYEEIRRKMMSVLWDIKDPQLGIPAMSFVLKKEDALCLGQGGDIAPDVVFAFNPLWRTKNPLSKQTKDVIIDDYRKAGPSHTRGLSSGTHGKYLGSTTFSIGTMNAVFLMAGRGIKQRYERKHPIWLRDIAPTIAHMLGIPKPAQAQGTVLTDMLT